MPGPVSVTVMRTAVVLGAWAETPRGDEGRAGVFHDVGPTSIAILPPLGVYLSEFDKRLDKTTLRRTGSPRMPGVCGSTEQFREMPDASHRGAKTCTTSPASLATLT